MPGSREDRLERILSDLRRDEWRKFRGLLNSVAPPGGFEPIPLSELRRAKTAFDLRVKMTQYYGDLAAAEEVTRDVLQRIPRWDLVERLEGQMSSCTVLENAPVSSASSIDDRYRLLQDLYVAQRQLRLSEGYRSVEWEETRPRPAQLESIYYQVPYRQYPPGAHCSWEIEWRGWGADISLKYTAAGSREEGHSFLFLVIFLLAVSVVFVTKTVFMTCVLYSAFNSLSFQMIFKLLGTGIAPGPAAPGQFQDGT
ncbi:uncharacterized protein [Lepisosteus oculatus]|uniref:uncharacterized protein isoform X2 n=1 Tax=Lepisosteus oculatus TaxID=7918 RepID=UPI00371C3C31